MILNIAGGTYYEVCKDPIWDELYGSGLRAAHALSARQSSIRFHTYIGNGDYEILKTICTALNISLNAIKISDTFEFVYQHPLANPFFTIPEPISNTPTLTDDFFLQFGTIEGNFKIKAKKVVYDPQSPGRPLSFWSNGSQTDELIWVANMQEVIKFTGYTDFKEIKEYLFYNEKVHAAVIKNGSDGAILVQKTKSDFEIPLFKTKHVWPIGTGDIFSSVFSYNYLIDGKSLEEASIQASLSTAYYTETNSLPIPLAIDETSFDRFYKKSSLKKKVYLAGPFFNMAQRWIIDQFRIQLLKFGLEVFSPYHDIGFGDPEFVVPLDISAIECADIVLAVVDGLDTGTIFEIGYAKALKIPIVVFVENDKEEALTMIKGTDCMIEKDFSTAIYKTVWESYK